VPQWPVQNDGVQSLRRRSADFREPARRKCHYATPQPRPPLDRASSSPSPLTMSQFATGEISGLRAFARCLDGRSGRQSAAPRDSGGSGAGETGHDLGAGCAPACSVRQSRHGGNAQAPRWSDPAAGRESGLRPMPRRWFSQRRAKKRKGWARICHGKPSPLFRHA
jgi:hypothetical protein